MATRLHEIWFENVEHAAAFVAAVSRQLASPQVRLLEHQRGEFQCIQNPEPQS